jgi:hypothetical protein
VSVRVEGNDRAAVERACRCPECGELPREVVRHVSYTGGRTRPLEWKTRTVWHHADGVEHVRETAGTIPLEQLERP